MEDGSLVLIGTGHVFRIQDAISDAIRAIRPDDVFVELDRGRLNALLHRERTGEVPQGKGGFVHDRLQRFQQDVALRYGAEVGGEMVAAVKAGQEIGARVHLIDRSGSITIRRALKELTWRERLRAVGQFAKASVSRLLPNKGPDMETELRKYQENPAAAIEELRRQYPTVWRVVIDERDEEMSQAVRRGLRGKGVAVVGDGHVDGMLRRFEDLDVTTYRLDDVRNDRLPKPAGDFHIGFVVDAPPQDLS